MRVLTLSTLDPDVESLEQYLEELCQEEFDQLLKVANSDLSHLSDDDFSDISALSANIYASEMDIDPIHLIDDINMLQTVMQRFLSSIVIYSLIQKEMIIKEEDDAITLYKDLNFIPTEKGKIINNMNLTY